jgi:hypothetical protein
MGPLTTTMTLTSSNRVSVADITNNSGDGPSSEHNNQYLLPADFSGHYFSKNQVNVVILLRDV